MGNSVKGASQVREVKEIGNYGNNEEKSTAHVKEARKEQNDRIGSRDSRDRLAVEETDTAGKTPSRVYEMMVESKRPGKVGEIDTDDNTDLLSQQRHLKTISKFTVQNHAKTQSNPTENVQVTENQDSHISLNSLVRQPDVGKKHSHSSRPVPNSNTRKSPLQNVGNAYEKSRAKSDHVGRRQVFLSKGKELSVVHRDENVVDETLTESEKHPAVKENRNIKNSFKSAPDAHVHGGAVNHIGKTESKLRTQSHSVHFKKKPDKEGNDFILQKEKVEENQNRVNTKNSTSDLHLKTSEVFQKSSQSLPNTRTNDRTIKERSKITNERRVQSDPVKPKPVKTLKEPGLEYVREVEENKDRPNSEMSQLSEQVLEVEITEGSIGTDGREYEISSSLRSTALDSRLFESESSIDTHTSMEIPKPTSRYSDNKQKLKAGLLDLYRLYDFGLPAFPVLPVKDKPTATPRYWPPWMTVTRRIETEEDLEQVEEYDTLDSIDMNNYETEKTIDKLHEIFHHETGETKNVYVVGESGTGKTAFCRHLVKQWCRQHQREQARVGSKETMFSALENEDDFSEEDHASAKHIASRKAGKQVQFDLSSGNLQNSKTSESRSLIDYHKVFGDVDELAKYEFLFYVPLFYNSNHDRIHDMIKTQFRNILNRMKLKEDVKGTKSNPGENAAFLNELLEKESDKILILLDGLDQWRPGKTRYKTHKFTSAMPLKDPSRLYTVITTSSSQKLREIGIEPTHLDLEIKLYGVDEKTSCEIVKEVINGLNKYHGQEKKSDDMIREMNGWKAKRYQNLPYTLIALCCLWFHSGVIGITLCDIFSRILELQFKSFNDFETNASHKPTAKPLPKSSKQFNDTNIDVQLPRYFINLSNCQINKELIYLLGQNAWLTRKQTIKVFDFSTIEIYGYSHTDAHNLIKAGILTQQKCSDSSELELSKKVFFADERIQEFFATTYIGVLCRNEAYGNMGNVDAHTRKIRTVMDDYFDVFSSIESILDFSVMAITLCGLYPPTTEQITQKIYDTVSKDKRALAYRGNLEDLSEDHVLYDIQDVLFYCAHESLSVNTDAITLHIGDLSYGNVDAFRLKYVVPEEVKSLSINANHSTEYSPKAAQTSDFIYQSRIYSKLQKLLIKDEISHLTLQDIESLYVLIDLCANSLKVISFVFTNTSRIIYQRITLDLDRLLPKMSHLVELEIRHIKLSHNKFSSLSSALSEMMYLKRLKLSDIACEMQRCDGEEHKMDFSEYDNLELIDIDGRELPVIGISNTRIVTCILGNLPQGPEIQTFSSLRRAKRLKHFTQKVRQRPPFISQTLIKTLNTWHMIESLHLEGVNFGENVLVLNKKLQSLSHIRLVETRMSRVAWCHFVDSLPQMDQCITVVTRDIHITPIKEDVTRDTLRRPIDAETRAVMLARGTERQEAFEYVKGKQHTFSVVFDMKNMFDFEKDEVL